MVSPSFLPCIQIQLDSVCTPMSLCHPLVTHSSRDLPLLHGVRRPEGWAWSWHHPAGSGPPTGLLCVPADPTDMAGFQWVQHKPLIKIYDSVPSLFWNKQHDCVKWLLRWVLVLVTGQSLLPGQWLLQGSGGDKYCSDGTWAQLNGHSCPSSMF